MIYRFKIVDCAVGECLSPDCIPATPEWIENHHMACPVWRRPARIDPMTTEAGRGFPVERVEFTRFGIPRIARAVRDHHGNVVARTYYGHGEYWQRTA